MHLTYAKMLAIVMRENMKLGDNTLNNERLTFVNTKFFAKILANCSPYKCGKCVSTTKMRSQKHLPY